MVYNEWLCKRGAVYSVRVAVPTSSYYFTEVHNQTVSTNNHMLHFFDQVGI